MKTVFLPYMIQGVTKSLIFKRMGHIREEMKADSMPNHLLFQ